MKLGPDIPTIDGDEIDALSRKARHWLRWRPGERRAVRRKYWRRSRHFARGALQFVKRVARGGVRDLEW